MTEQWKDIPGYEGLYEVSDLGRVRRVWKRTRRLVAIVRSAQHGAFVKLSRDNRKKTYRLARLMLTVWCPIDKPEIHIAKFRSDDRTDCRLCNLYWSMWIDPGHNAKLTPARVRAIRALWMNSDLSYREIGQRFDMSHEAIGKVIRGELWKHVTDEPVTEGSGYAHHA